MARDLGEGEAGLPPFLAEHRPVQALSRAEKDLLMECRVQSAQSGHNLTSVLNNPRDDGGGWDWDAGAEEDEVPPSTLPEVSLADFQPFLMHHDALQQRFAANHEADDVPGRSCPEEQQDPVADADAHLAAAFRQVPERFFRPDFSLHEARVLEGDGQGQGQDDHETLSAHLDVVEVALLKQISSRSDSLFSALATLNELHRQVAASVAQVHSLRAGVRRVQEVTTTRPAAVVRLQRHRERAAAAARKLALVQRVRDTRDGVEALMEARDFSGALALVDEARGLLRGELAGVRCLQAAREQLDQYDRLLSDLMVSGCVQLAVAWELGDDAEGGGAETVEERLARLLRGLAARAQVGKAMDGFRRALGDDLDVAVATVVVESAVVHVPGFDSDDPEAALRALPTDDFVSCLEDVFEHALGLVRRAQQLRDVALPIVAELPAALRPREEAAVRAAADAAAATAEQRVVALLAQRAEQTARARLPELQRLWERASAFAGALGTSRELRPQLLALVQRHVAVAADSARATLTTTLENEKWKAAQVAPDRQAAVDALARGRATAGSVAGGAGAADDGVDFVEVGGARFRVVWSVLLLVDVLGELLAAARAFPAAVVPEVTAAVVSLLRLFADRAKRFVLDPKTTKLKKVFPKHLVLATNSLSLLLELAPHCKAALAAHVDEARRAVLFVELDRAAEALVDDRERFLAQLGDLGRILLNARCKRVAEFDWDAASRAVLAPVVDNVAKDTGKLHKALGDNLLPAGQIYQVFTRVFAVFEERLPVEFAPVNPATPEGRAKVVSDMAQLTAALRRLSEVPELGPGLEEHFLQRFG